jgi:hypothetical protein
MYSVATAGGAGGPHEGTHRLVGQPRRLVDYELADKAIAGGVAAQNRVQFDPGASRPARLHHRCFRDRALPILTALDAEQRVVDRLRHRCPQVGAVLGVIPFDWIRHLANPVVDRVFDLARSGPQAGN